MVESQTLSIFIPLLFLVVIELSKLAKEIDLHNMVEGEYHPFLLGFFPFITGVYEVGLHRIGGLFELIQWWGRVLSTGFPRSAQILSDFRPNIVVQSEFISIPRLGRFNFLHGINFLLLSLGLFLIKGLPPGEIAFVLASMIWLVWILLPVLEVSEYDDILSTMRPWSFLFHAVLSSLTALYVIFSTEVNAVLESEEVIWFLGWIIPGNLMVVMMESFDRITTFVIYIILFAVSVHVFLIQLEKEIKER